jgi:CBS domain-containing protein
MSLVAALPAAGPAAHAAAGPVTRPVARSITDTPAPASLEQPHDGHDHRLCVADVMSTGTESITLGSTVGAAVAAMVTAGVQDLPVVDEDANFVGVLSMSAVLRAAAPDAERITAETGSVETAFAFFVGSARASAGLTIDPLVDRRAAVARPDDHVARVATLMLGLHLDRLPVVVADVVLGSVSRSDVCHGMLGVRHL